MFYLPTEAARDNLTGMLMEAFGMLFTMKNYILVTVLSTLVTFGVVFGLMEIFVDLRLPLLLIHASWVTYILPLVGTLIAGGITETA